MAYSNIVNSSYFFGPLLVAQKSDLSVSAGLAVFIDEYEPKFLYMVLGYELYKAYLLGIDVVTPAQKWVDLLNGVEYTSLDGRTNY